MSTRSNDEKYASAEPPAEGRSASSGQSADSENAETLARSSSATLASDPLSSTTGDEETESPSAAPGRILGGRYRIHQLLGRGGMGEVWRAYDVKLRMDVALKSLHDSFADAEESLEIL